LDETASRAVRLLIIIEMEPPFISVRQANIISVENARSTSVTLTPYEIVLFQVRFERQI